MGIYTPWRVDCYPTLAGNTNIFPEVKSTVPSGWEYIHCGE
jgi:hypothetical protein